MSTVTVERRRAETAPRISALQFDEATHTYLLDGRNVPSVTQVLSLLDPVTETPELRAAGERGTIVHDACQYHDEGCLDESGVDEEIIPYLAAYRRFRSECAFEVVEVEVPVYDLRQMYAGRVDRVVTMEGSLVILDLKSGAERRTHPLQLAAYRQAFESCMGHRVKRAACVYLRSDGSYTLKWQEGSRDIYDFLAALRCYRWRNP